MVVNNTLAHSLLNRLRFLGRLWLLFVDVIKEFLTPPIYLKLIVEQIHFVGNRSILLVLITAASIGMVMALQFGIGLAKFGGKLYVPKIVSLSIIKEMGPVFTCIMLAARVGAGIASEIGSMVVTQQIDAIRALGTSPLRRVVVPRVIACVIAAPILATLANFVGILGALLVCTTELGLDPNFFIQKVMSTIQIGDYLSGMGKVVFFSLIIGLCSCYYGLNAKSGTRGVGAATTKAVVTASITIIVSDFFLTKLFWMLRVWLAS